MQTIGWVDLVGDWSGVTKFSMECEMAKKGFWIGHINITNPERYKDYLAANAAPFKNYGARFLVRNGTCEEHGGALQGRRHVVIEFESYATAKACHDHPSIRRRQRYATKPAPRIS